MEWILVYVFVVCFVFWFWLAVVLPRFRRFPSPPKVRTEAPPILEFGLLAVGFTSSGPPRVPSEGFSKQRHRFVQHDGDLSPMTFCSSWMQGWWCDEWVDGSSIGARVLVKLGSFGRPEGEKVARRFQDLVVIDPIA